MSMIRPLIFILIALCVALTQTGCDVGLRHTASYNYLLLELHSNRSQAKVDESIHVRFTVTNTGQQSTVVESQDTPVMDIVAGVTVDGKLLTWSSQNPNMVAHRLEWKPGESKVIELVWTPKQEDIVIGAFHDVHLAGRLYKDSKSIQSAGVDVCASDVCR